MWEGGGIAVNWHSNCIICSHLVHHFLNAYIEASSSSLVLHVSIFLPHLQCNIILMYPLNLPKPAGSKSCKLRSEIHPRQNFDLKGESCLILKPQDSFGEFNTFCLDLQKVQEIIRKHHQTFLQLFWMTYCKAILPYGKILCTYMYWQSVRGASEHFDVWDISWKWKHFWASC